MRYSDEILNIDRNKTIKAAMLLKIFSFLDKILKIR